MSAKRRSPLLAGLASSVLPGAGQVLTGARAAGWMLLVSTATTAVLTSWGLVSAESQSLLGMITDPDLLLVLVGINLVFGLIRLLSVTDAWHRAGGRMFRFGLALLVVFTVVPHAALAYVGLETRSTIMRVFPTTGSATVSTSTTTTTTTTPPSRTEPLVTPWTLPTIVTTSSTTTTTIPLGAERVTFLLLGGDAGPGRAGLRTDSVMVLTVDTLTGAAAIFGLPRNMAGLQFSDGTPFPGMNEGILNEVYQYGVKNPQRFGGPDPGIVAVRDVVATALGIPIDYHVLVEMQGFAEVVDTLGGVTVNPDHAFVAPLYYGDPGEYEMITFQPGEQHLDGAHALAYARSRTSSNDYRRMERQRCLVTSLVAAASPYRLMSGLIGLLDVMERRVSTDIPVSELPFLINFAPKIQTDQIVFVAFDVDYRSGSYTSTGHPITDFDRVRSTVASVIDGSWDGSLSNLGISAEVCA